MYPIPGFKRFCNLHGGTAQFYKQIDQGLDFPIQSAATPACMSRTDMEALIDAVASDPQDENGTGFFQ